MSIHLSRARVCMRNLFRFSNGGIECRRKFAHNLAERERTYSIGDRLYGYTVEHVVPVPELSLFAVYLRHVTGAHHLHLSRQDSDNVFGVALRTTPRDSTGIPHILEHLSLCGSAKFPVRDPFFKMLTRSLSTFMNAFTASDWTMYPFSTQNPQDYQNLMSVYLDAVFFPLLRPLDFCQEGWRLEHKDPQDPKSPIVLKGVVYNEMKGAFSNSQQLFAERAQNYLLPSHTYGVVSGGDPAHIPDLTWQKLKEFHTHHYHPSNARFYTYGNFPLEDHLKQINDQVLSKFQSAKLDTSVPREPRWNAPREATIHCASDPMSPDPQKQTTVAVCYLLNDITNVNEACALSILSSLLVEGEKAPFYQSLIESNLGSDYAPNVGYNGYTRESTFAVGLQRVDPKDVETVKQIIDRTFDEIIRDGFPQERIDAVLHKIELSHKHQMAKFGLNLGISILPSWTHDGDPTELLQVNKQVEWFKNQLASNPRYLQDLVAKYFKNNTHRLTLVMNPDENYNKSCQEVEEEKLRAKLETLTEVEKENVYKTGLELLDQQSRKEEVSCLPTLKTSDIVQEIEPVHLISSREAGVLVYQTTQPTNGVSYFRAVSSFSSLPSHLKPYIPLFCGIVTKMGLQSMDYKDLSQWIELKTGGLSVSPLVSDHRSDEKLFEQSVQFSSLCLNRNVTEMFNLWTEIFNSLSLADVARLQTLIQIEASDTASGLSDHGHRLAMTYAGSELHASAATNELMAGMTQVHLMKSLAESTDIDTVVGNLKQIADHVMSRNNLRCFVTSTADHVDDVYKSTAKFIHSLPLTNSQSHKEPSNNDPLLNFYSQDSDFVSRPACTHFELPFQVNYVARSLPAPPYSHGSYPSLRILAKILTTRYLHREVREKGGAYGGGATCDSGLFHFYSYRDPNLLRTLDTFNDAAKWAAEGTFSQEDIDEAKLSLFSQVDSPVVPGSKCMRQFLHGIDDRTFQQHRQRLLAVDKKSLVDAAKQYLIHNKQTSVTVLGPTNQTTQESPDWIVKKQEL